MYHNESCAAKGTDYGSRNKHLATRSMQRAAVSIYKTDASYELLVFAPGRIKEHFHINVKGKELTISYTPPEGFQRPDWVLREYSRGGFARTFIIDDTDDVSNISAKYQDGVLQVSVPLIPGKESVKQEITIN